MGDRMATGRLFAAITLTAMLTMGAAAVAAAPIRVLPVSPDSPSATIGNGLIKAKIYLIDPGKGFYRGQRFDQAGVVGSLTFGGQEFYGPWFDRVSSEDLEDPYTPQGLVVGFHSAISGPVEEFAPIGFDEAMPGGTFLKVGVGMLRKPDHKDYDHGRSYDLIDAGQRGVTVTDSGVTFTQDIAGGFHYLKRLQLVPGKPQMRIEHELTNTGIMPINTNVYDHNFLKLSPGNGDVMVTLPYAITPDIMPNAGTARIRGNHIAYVRPLVGEERVAFLISGFGDNARDYDIKVENTKTGAGMRVTGDQKLVKMYLWSIRTVMAVEPHIGIELAPGETKRWTYTYTYSAPTR